MPKLIQLYIRSVAIGFGLAAVFVSLLLGMDMMGLRSLIVGSDVGVLAVFLLWFMNGIVFAGVQFGWAIMSLAERDDAPRGGRRMRADLVAIPVRGDQTRKPRSAGR